jgi:hypothetical protein
MPHKGEHRNCADKGQTMIKKKLLAIEYKRIMEFAKAQIDVAHHNMCRVLENRPTEIEMSLKECEEAAKLWNKLNEMYRDNWHKLQAIV